MPRPTLKDRLLTKPVAEAMMSPAGILLAGVGAAVGIATGLPLAVAAAIGAGAWVARVAVAVPRGPTRPRVQPSRLDGEWRRFTQEAVGAQRRFDEAVGRIGTGPLRDRLGEVGERVDDGVQEVWRIAQAGQALEEARSALDVERVEREILELGPAHKGEAGTGIGRAREALQAQLESARRLDDTIATSRDRLRVLDARLDESVARAIELSVTGVETEELAGLGADVEGVVAEMEALRQALDETSSDRLGREG